VDEPTLESLDEQITRMERMVDELYMDGIFYEARRTRPWVRSTAVIEAAVKELIE
jgi:hypothetical protein